MSTFSGQIADQIAFPELVGKPDLHVILVISNPIRVHSRLRLFRETLERLIHTHYVKVYVVEAAFGDREHEIMEWSEGEFSVLQLRTKSEIWIKENMINLAVRRLLPLDWKYVAWVDGDITFHDPNWALETMHQLQHFEILQPWQTAADLGPTGEVIQVFKSFGYVDQLGVQKQCNPTDPYEYAHSGYAWACTRKFYEAVSGLMDFAVLGSADHHMAWAATGLVDYTIHKGMSKSFFRRAHLWQDKAMLVTDGQVGYVNGTISHGFHGPKKRRYYRERWQILVDDHYDPDLNLVYDEQGLAQLHDNRKLERDVRKYNRSRYEDSIEA